MSISPINFNGMIQNTNEISHTKANEDQKPLTQQDFLTGAVEKKVEQEAHQVNDPYNAKRSEDKYDREGNGSGYEGNQKRRPPKEQKKDSNKNDGDGKVLEKPKPSFDMRI
ncbi:MAG: hypothetical protein IKP29_06670 [Pseudobutyrivibrio sp.]|nr:hypothetical protein [Pseudobutyrivibrio sp.]